MRLGNRPAPDSSPGHVGPHHSNACNQNHGCPNRVLTVHRKALMSAQYTQTLQMPSAWYRLLELRSKKRIWIL